MAGRAQRSVGWGSRRLGPRTKHQRSLKDKFRKLRDSWVRIANDEKLSGDAAREQERPAKGD